MSKDLTPLEQAQRAYRDLRGMLEEAERLGVEMDSLFLEAPQETDGTQELLKKVAHLCHLCHQGLAMCTVYKLTSDSSAKKAEEAAKKAAMALQKDAEERQAGIDEVANKALEHLNTARELQNEYESLCGHCAEQNPADAVYCRRCGKEIERPEEEDEKVEEAKEEIEETD